MPSRLIPRNPQIFQQELERAAAAVQRQSIKHRSPWAGYLPDIDPHNLPANAANPVQGLVARPDPSGRGELLMPDFGFAPSTQEDPIVSLPLGADANTDLAITLLFMHPRTDASGDRTGEFQLVPVAISAGNETNAGSMELWWFVPSTQLWTEAVFDTSGGAITAPMGGRERLADVAIMPSGAPNRGAYRGPVNQPAAVIANGFDPVQIFPCGTAAGAQAHMFQDLTNQHAPFIARTVEAFNGRIYFGNTSEAGTHHRQRIRWTAPFTADPLVTNVGAGALDVRDFNRDLLRLEKLGNVMAAYFEDGVAFLRNTGVATAPVAIQVLKEKRGLISTHAMTPVGDNAHFGIFDDGWWLLDASGRWTELGVATIDGVRVPKWRDTFFNNLDIDNRSRLAVSYDGFYIRIAYPTTGEDDIEDVWIYDPRTDRVFTDRYPVTCWGLVDAQIATQVLWSSAVIVGETWSTIIGSWSSFGARYGLQNLMHGSLNGWVMTHDADLITRWNTATLTQEFPGYTFRSPFSSLGEPRFLKTAQKLWVEFIHANSPDMTLRVSGGSFDGAEVAESGVVSLQPTGYEAGAVLTAFRTFNLTATNLFFEVSGTSPVAIRSFESDFIIHPWEERR
jgi:hypothetical protein